MVELIDVARNWLRLQTHVHSIPHPYDILKEIILASCYAVDGHMSPPLHCFTFCAGGGGILRNLGYG